MRAADELEFEFNGAVSEAISKFFNWIFGINFGERVPLRSLFIFTRFTSVISEDTIESTVLFNGTPYVFLDKLDAFEVTLGGC